VIALNEEKWSKDSNDEMLGVVPERKQRRVMKVNGTTSWKGRKAVEGGAGKREILRKHAWGSPGRG
jgi:hypothetical protein